MDEREEVEWVAERAERHRVAELTGEVQRELADRDAVHAAVRRGHEALLELLMREHLAFVIVHLRARHATPQALHSASAMRRYCGALRYLLITAISLVRPLSPSRALTQRCFWR